QEVAAGGFFFISRERQMQRGDGDVGDADGVGEGDRSVGCRRGRRAVFHVVQLHRRRDAGGDLRDRGGGSAVGVLKDGVEDDLRERQAGEERSLGRRRGRQGGGGVVARRGGGQSQRRGAED